MGKPTPKDPPDYTADKAAFSSGEYENRINQANEYNSAVSGFNDTLRGYSGDIGSLRSNINNLTIREDELFGNYGNQLDNLYSNLSGMSFDESKPNFESVVQSPYGAVQVGAPTLKNVNSNLQNQHLSDIRGLQSSLSGLRQQRTTEEDRINSFANNLTGQISSFGNQLAGLTIADKGQMDNLRSQLGGVNTQLNTFTSNILDEVRPQGFTNVLGNLSGVQSNLDNLYTQRGNEETRIKGFKDSLFDTSNDYAQRLSGLNIANLSGMDALQQDIDSRQQQATRFESPLSFDFNQPLNELQGIEDRLGGLYRDRNTEQSRIQSAQQDALNVAGNLSNSLANADYYSLSNLKNLTNQLNTVNSSMSNFSSPLDFDFSNAQNLLGEAQGGLDDLYSLRSNALTDFQSRADTANTGINDIELHNEAALRERLTQAQGGLTDLSRFSGTDVSPITAGFNTAISGVNTRLNELNTKRADLEHQAQLLRDRVLQTSYANQDGISGSRSELDSLKAEVDLYNASQALDEINEAISRLTNEDNRLARDAASVNSRQSSEQEQVLAMLANAGLLTGSNGVNLTPEQYMALLAQGGGNEQEIAPSLLSAFSSNVLRI